MHHSSWRSYRAYEHANLRRGAVRIARLLLRLRSFRVPSPRERCPRELARGTRVYASSRTPITSAGCCRACIRGASRPRRPCTRHETEKVAGHYEAGGSSRAAERRTQSETLRGGSPLTPRFTLCGALYPRSAHATWPHPRFVRRLARRSVVGESCSPLLAAMKQAGYAWRREP
jgi:hypothetical protein